MNREYKRAIEIGSRIGAFSRNGCDDYLIFREGMLGTVEIFDIEVKNKRQGIGTALLNDLKEKYPRIYLYTQANNWRAKKFYIKNGFRAVALINDFYATDGEAAHALMFFWKRE